MDLLTPEGRKVRKTIRFVAVMLAMSCTFAGSDKPGGDPHCQGSSCLVIYNVRTGTRCNSSDSVEADVVNQSDSLYLRGWVIFTKANGKQDYQPTDALKPGQKLEGMFVCHGAGAPSALANTGTDRDTLKYPPHP